MATGDYNIAIYRTGFHANDAHTAYLEMGSPRTLSQAQLQTLSALTQDPPEQRVLHVAPSGQASLSVPMHDYDVVLIKLWPQGR